MTGQSLYYSGTAMCFKSNIKRADAQRDMIDSNTEKKKGNRLISRKSNSSNEKS